MFRFLVVAAALALAARPLGRAQASGPESFASTFARFVQSATDQELYQFLWAMPKGGDIHMHFGLSSWASEWWEEGKDRYYTRIRVSGCKIESAPLLYANLPRAEWEKLTPCERSEFVPLHEASRDVWISALTVDQPGEGRDEFFERIVPRVSGLNRDTDTAYRVLRRSLARWQRENIRYIEMMALPRDAASVEALKRLADSSPVPVRFQGLFIRFAPDAEQRLLQVADFIAANREHWVGINMAGREDNDKGYALRFLEPFREMRRRHHGIRISLHAGEVDSPGPQVRDTLKLGAERIGHGINLISDPEGMLLAKNGRVLIEVNLISNRLLEYVNDPALHPALEYLRFGIPVCLNSDDQGSWDSSLTDEYFVAVRSLGLSWDELVAMGRASIDYSFAPYGLKSQLRADYDAALAAFPASDWRRVRPEPSGYARRVLLRSGTNGPPPSNDK